jgi:hypothetical protein
VPAHTKSLQGLFMLMFAVAQNSVSAVIRAECYGSPPTTLAA